MGNRKLMTPPDGGWGYVVMMSAFFVAFLIDGIANSFGLLLPILVDTFKVSVPLASLSSGVLTGVTFLIAPITARLVTRFGHRPVAFVGGLVTFGSMAVASFSVNIEMFIVFYGAIAGMGLGLVYLPSLTMVNAYFERKRGVVMGVVTCGSGIGLLIIAFLIETLIRIYTWRGCLLIISGLYLNLSICASLLRPLQYTEVESSESSSCSRDKESTDEEEWLSESDGEETKDDKEQQYLKQVFIGCSKELNESQSFKSSAKYYISCSNIISQIQASTYSERSAKTFQTARLTQDSMDESLSSGHPAAQQMLRFLDGRSPSFLSVELWDEKGQQPKDSRQDVIVPQNFIASPLLKHSFDTRSESFLNVEEQTAFPHYPCPIEDVSGGLLPSRDNPVLSSQDLAPTRKVHSSLSLAYPEVSSLQQSPGCKNGIQYTSLFYDDVRFYRPRHIQQDESMVRSLLRLPTNGSLRMLNQPLEMTDPAMSVASLASRYTTYITSPSDDSTIEGVVHSDDITITSSIPKPLVRDSVFILFCAGAFLTQLANNLPGMFVPSYALSIGLSSAQAANIVSILGISNTVGRFLAGYISFMGVGSLRIYNTGIVLAGIACILVLFCSTYAHLLVFAVAFGFSLGSVPPLQSVILVELLGIERLPSSFGVMCFCKSIACMTGPSIAGGLYEMARDYQVTLVFAGTIFLLAGVLHVVLAICRRNCGHKVS